MFSVWILSQNFSVWTLGQNFSFRVFIWNFMGLRSKPIKLGNSYCNIGAQTPDYPRLAGVWPVASFWFLALGACALAPFYCNNFSLMLALAKRGQLM